MTRVIIGMVAGGLLGYAAYRFMGCSTGACALTANPWTSTLIGVIFGAVMVKI